MPIRGVMRHLSHETRRDWVHKYEIYFKKKKKKKVQIYEIYREKLFLFNWKTKC